MLIKTIDKERRQITVTKNKTASFIMFLVHMFSAIVVADSVNEYGDLNDLTAKAAILMDGTNGTVIFEKDSSERLPLASITKVVSMIVVMDEIRDNNLSYKFVRGN